jgi:hypothetical protein
MSRVVINHLTLDGVMQARGRSEEVAAKAGRGLPRRRIPAESKLFATAGSRTQA